MVEKLERKSWTARSLRRALVDLVPGKSGQEVSCTPNVYHATHDVTCLKAPDPTIHEHTSVSC